MKRKLENGEEEKELVLDTDGADEASVEAVAETGGPGTAPTPDALAGLVGPPPPSAPQADPLTQIGAEAPYELAAEEKPPEGDPASPRSDDTLDPGLMDLFREAKNEVQDTTLASDLPDIPIQELLDDLVSISRRLGISSQARPKPNELREGGK
jgi:hypothetical protein